MKNTKKDILAHYKKQVIAEIKKKYPTMEQFCWDNDLNKATLSNLLNDKKDFRVSTLARIAEALGKKISISLG